MGARRSVLRAKLTAGTSVADRIDRAAALEELLVEKGVLTEAEVEAKATEVRGRRRMTWQELNQVPRGPF